MSGTVWTKFYWADWQSDPALRLCTYSERGLWMDILCIAAAHDPIGYVAVAGRGLNETDIARMTGGSESEVHALLGALEQNGVFSRDRKGTIYSRRMVADAKKAALAKKNGKTGGNPSLSKDKENQASDKGVDKPSLKPHKPVTISQSQAAVEPLPEVIVSEISRLNAILGLDDRDFNKHAANIRTLAELHAEGCDFEKHIRPAAEKCAAKRPGSLAYICKPAREMRDAECMVSALPVPFENCSEVQWRDRLRAFDTTGGWPEKWGPRPNEGGCRVPVAIMAQTHPPHSGEAA